MFRPVQDGWGFGGGKYWLGLSPQVAFCHGWLLPRPRMVRPTSSNASPPLSVKWSSPHARLVWTPLVKVTRFSSSRFTRPPDQMKLAGLLRSILVVIVG